MGDFDPTGGVGILITEILDIQSPPRRHPVKSPSAISMLSVVHMRTNRTIDPNVFASAWSRYKYNVGKTMHAIHSSLTCFAT